MINTELTAIGVPSASTARTPRPREGGVLITHLHTRSSNSTLLARLGAAAGPEAGAGRLGTGAAPARCCTGLDPAFAGRNSSNARCRWASAPSPPACVAMAVDRVKEGTGRDPAPGRSNCGRAGQSWVFLPATSTLGPPKPVVEAGTEARAEATFGFLCPHWMQNLSCTSECGRPVSRQYGPQLTVLRAAASAAAEVFMVIGVGLVVGGGLTEEGLRREDGLRMVWWWIRSWTDDLRSANDGEEKKREESARMII